MKSEDLSNSGAVTTLEVDDVEYTIHAIDVVSDSATLPFSLKVLLENLLRTRDGTHITSEHIHSLAAWDPTAEPHVEIPFTPSRVLTQDLSGGPAIIDLVAMRGIVEQWGGDPAAVNPLTPVELVIDHSVIVDVAGRRDAFERNVDLEYSRNQERYALLRWAQSAFDNLRIVPPGTGIVHQVNIEHLARVVTATDPSDGPPALHPDTCVGTDSHTPMVNGLGVLGWGVGGIEAEAAMLGQPISMLIPRVVGFKLTGAVPPGATATDVVLTITEMLRAHGVVGAFVEFHGPGVAALSVANRATIGNMSPEFGATAAMFPIDAATLDYLRLTGRGEHHIACVEAYAKRQGMWHDENTPEPRFSSHLALDLSTVVPSIAGPRRPHDRIEVSRAKEQFALDVSRYSAATSAFTIDVDGDPHQLRPGALAIAAITSCTNTSNPTLMMAAAMLARAAVDRGLTVPPWVRTSMAPGSKVVTGYLDRAGLWPALENLGFHLVGYGCTTCMGNSGPIHEAVSDAVHDQGLVVASVLSGNRNFEGRVHPDVTMNYLASPPLVIAYALAGSIDVDFATEPVGTDKGGSPVFLRDIWPAADDVERVIAGAVSRDLFRRDYADVFAGDDRWRALATPPASTFTWDEESTYVRRPPYFDNITREAAPVRDIRGARVLVRLGDSVSTDQISPAGAIGADSAAGQYLSGMGVHRRDFNSFGARRGNYEVMLRGTFAAARIRNLLLDDVDGGITRDFTREGGPQSTVYDAASAYVERGWPSIVLAGAEYGIGSSRDWAAKGPRLLGVRAVIAESFERIHRSNLIGMGVLPLEFPDGVGSVDLGLDGTEVFDILGIEDLNTGRTPATVEVRATAGGGDVTTFTARVRLDTPAEAEYYRHDGILPYVLRQLVG